MGAYRCPVCENKIDFWKKCRYAIWGKGGLVCGSCGTALRIKRYGSGRSDATLVVCIVYFFLGIKTYLLPVCILASFAFSFLRKLVSPLEAYDPDRKISVTEWIIIGIAVVALLVALWLDFAAK